MDMHVHFFCWLNINTSLTVPCNTSLRHLELRQVDIHVCRLSERERKDGMRGKERME